MADAPPEHDTRGAAIADIPLVLQSRGVVAVCAVLGLLGLVASLPCSWYGLCSFAFVPEGIQVYGGYCMVALSALVATVVTASPANPTALPPAPVPANPTHTPLTASRSSVRELSTASQPSIASQESKKISTPAKAPCGSPPTPQPSPPPSPVAVRAQEVADRARATSVGAEMKLNEVLARTPSPSPPRASPSPPQRRPSSPVHPTPPPLLRAAPHDGPVFEPTVPPEPTWHRRTTRVSPLKQRTEFHDSPPQLRDNNGRVSPAVPLAVHLSPVGKHPDQRQKKMKKQLREYLRTMKGKGSKAQRLKALLEELEEGAETNERLFEQVFREAFALVNAASPPRRDLEPPFYPSPPPQLPQYPPPPSPYPASPVPSPPLPQHRARRATISPPRPVVPSPPRRFVQTPTPPNNLAPLDHNNLAPLDHNLPHLMPPNIHSTYLVAATVSE